MTSAQPQIWTTLIWRGQELAFIEDFDNLVSAVQWARKITTQDFWAGVDSIANIAPKGAES